MKKPIFNPIALYIHTPWCVKKCPYCDFNSHAQKGAIPEAAYIDALIQDFADKSRALEDRTIDTVFIGGGTPSLLSPEAYHTLFTALKKHAHFAAEAEITMEANPGTVLESHLPGYRDAGVNRLSIGAQSFQNAPLKTLGRIHTAEATHSAVQQAQNAGFKNINLDVMFGLPNQTIEDALFDLTQALALNPTHLSWYQLTLEPNTLFAAFPPALPEDDLIAEMHQTGVALLKKAGFLQYEISAFAKDNRRCEHNLHYWRFDDYLGIGAGAHGKITDVASQTISRQWNYKHPNDYLNSDKPFVENTHVVSEKELPLEFMMNRLRLHEAFSMRDFEEKTFLDFSVVAERIENACEKGFLVRNGDDIETTVHGKRFLNEVLEVFI